MGGAGRGYPLSDAGLVTTAHWHHGTGTKGSTNTAAKVAEGEAVGCDEDKSEEVLWECGGVLVKWSQDPGDSRE